MLYVCPERHNGTSTIEGEFVDQSAQQAVQYGTVKTFLSGRGKNFGFVFIDGSNGRQKSEEAFFHLNKMGHPVQGNDGVQLVPLRGKRKYRAPREGERIAFILGDPTEKGQRLKLWCPLPILSHVRRVSKLHTNRRPVPVS